MENIEVTPNRMACNIVITDENKNVLITEFKTSPKSPAAGSKLEKKKQYKKKPKKNLRQRKRLSSQTSDASQLQQVAAPNDAAYNLIEFYGDSSRSGSAIQENVAPFNQTAGTGSAIISSGSVNPQQSFTTCIGDYSTAGVSVRPEAPKNVIFVIPEGWASSIEIMRLPMNMFDNAMSSTATMPYEEQTDSVGPVRSKGKSYRSSRNTPYNSSRRGRQSYTAASELTSSAGRNNAGNPTFPENIDLDRCFTADRGYRYEPRDYEKTSSSIGPIRRSGRGKAFYTPYGSAARERRSYSSMDSASSSTTNDSYSQSVSSPYPSDGKNYTYSDKNKWILCWHCRRRGHVKINCPSRMTHKKY